MALVAGPRNRQKYAPTAQETTAPAVGTAMRAFGGSGVAPVPAPQPQYANVIEAYQQGGIPAALGMVFGAPDPGIGPMAVVQKAGTTPLKTLLTAQLSKALKAADQPANATIQSVKRIFGERRARAIKDFSPMVQNTIAKVSRAETGKPLNIVGHRVESAGGLVPGRGTFFSAKPSGAEPFDASMKMSVRQARRGPIPLGQTGPRRVDVIKLANPLVSSSGDQRVLIGELIHSKKLDKSLRKSGVALLSKRAESTASGSGEAWYTLADKWIARVARNLGHDGIIYKDTKEIVDLGGTLNIPKRGASR